MDFHRENLLHLLAEAAELEHNILCSYLYAAFSLKQSVAEDISEPELAVVQKWRKLLIRVSAEEMMHLAQVSNLMVALGARPHFNRPNLPAAPGYHPARIVVKLAPFNLETLDHFIFLERPEDQPVQDGQGFSQAAAGPPRIEPPQDFLMPRAPDYATIGEFYARLRTALEEVATSIGERALFCGPREQQLRGDEIGMTGLIVVSDLASALQAVQLIVEQGEGSRGDGERSHFKEFESIRKEFLSMQQSRPGFAPCRPVAENPVMHPPTVPDRVHVTAAAAAAVLDAANSVYGLMLRCLAMAYELPWSGKSAREAVLGAAIAAMKALSVLAGELARMPAQPGEGGPNAGLSFTMPRATEGLFSMALIAERLGQVGARVPQLGLPPDAADRVLKPLGAAQEQLSTLGEK